MNFKYHTTHHNNNHLTLRDGPNMHLQRRHTTAMASSPTPWEEINLANAWDITHTLLSRPTT